MTEHEDKRRAPLEALCRFWTRDAWRGEDRLDEQIDRFVSSYGGSPGHEGDYGLLDRLLWEMGKEREKGAREKGGSQKPEVGGQKNRR